MVLAIGERIRLDTLPSRTALTFCWHFLPKKGKVKLYLPTSCKQCRSANQTTFRKQ